MTAGDFTVRREGATLEIVSVDPAPPTVQVVAIFEGLAVTQRQLSAGLSVFIGSLDGDSIVDMQSVEGELDPAIIEAIDDLHARGAARPIILMLGQASEIAPSDLQSSQVRGRRRAADLSGRLDHLAESLAMHGILFYGIAVTDVPLTNFEQLAAGSGGPLSDRRRLGGVQRRAGRHRPRTGPAVSGVDPRGGCRRRRTAGHRGASRRDRTRGRLRARALSRRPVLDVDRKPSACIACTQ